MTNRETGLRPRHRCLACFLGALLASAGSVLAEDPPELFDIQELSTGTAARQSILTGFFLGGSVADIAALSIDADGHRRLRVYGFGGNDWRLELEALLGREVLFVDVAEIGGQDRLVTVERNRLNWFDPDTGTERLLMEVASEFDARSASLSYAGAEPRQSFDDGEIHTIDITRDLNGDGRDDLVVPSFDGFRVATQREDGSFHDALELGPGEPFLDRRGLDESRSYRDVGLSPLTVPWYLSRVHVLDHDGDGRNDLVFWNGDRFDVHHQDPNGRFDTSAARFDVDVPFDSDGSYSFAFGFGEKTTFALVCGCGRKRAYTVLHSFRDVDGDGVADLVTQTLEGRSLLKQRARFGIHFGSMTDGGLTFPATPDTTVRQRGTAPVGYSTIWLDDFDGDGQLDIAIGEIKTGFGRMILAMLGTSIAMGVELHRMENGSFPDGPTTVRSVKSDFDPTGGRDNGFFPAALMGDVNGDGYSDLLVGKSRDLLHVFLGLPEPEAITRRPLAVSVALPGDERNSRLVDLNRDGKQDVLMHHPSASEPHRVTLLISR